MSDERLAEIRDAIADEYRSHRCADVEDWLLDLVAEIERLRPIEALAQQLPRFFRSDCRVKCAYGGCPYGVCDKNAAALKLLKEAGIE